MCKEHKHGEEATCCGHHHHEHAGHEHDCACGGHHHHEHAGHEHGCGCGEHHHHHEHEGHEHSCGCGCGHHHGHDYEAPQGVSVQFSGVFNHSAEVVWDMLTNNEKVQQWFPELHFEAVETGGTLRFNYQTGGYEEMMVLDVEPPHFLSYTWDLNIVTFELMRVEENQTELVFTEWLPEINDHSPKDLTGWMIALQAIAEILEGKPVSDREEKFHELYPRIKEMLAQQANVEFED